MASRRVHKELFVTTPVAGSTTIPVGTTTTATAVTTELNSIDLSHAQALQCELHLTAIGTDVGDVLDVRLQSSSTNPNGIRAWTTRGRFPAILGNVTAPVRYVLNIEQAVAIAQSEQSYELTGDAGVTEIGAGTVINGPFPGKSRAAGNARAGATSQQASWRVLYVTTDANSNAKWVGSLTIWALDTVRL